MRASFIRPAATNNLTVRSTAHTAGAAPALMKAVLLVEEVDAATAGTDYSVRVSRDNGTTWATATLSETFTSVAPVSGMRVVQTDDVDVSGQPSGTQLIWEFNTHNNKRVYLHAWHRYFQ